MTSPAERTWTIAGRRRLPPWLHHGGCCRAGESPRWRQGGRVMSARERSALMQALWHMGTDEDRALVRAAGCAWTTDTHEALAMIRAALAKADPTEQEG